MAVDFLRTNKNAKIIMWILIKVAYNQNKTCIFILQFNSLKLFYYIDKCCLGFIEGKKSLFNLLVGKKWI